jgi:dethiobiotin synthetase
MTPGYFVTGTDTGVGKTFVSAALTRRARAAGKKVFAFKPIETGCDGLGPDQKILCATAGGWQTGSLRGLYHLRHPVAPLVASESEGIVLELDKIMQTFQEGVAQADFTIVEGAGGWRVPLTESADIATLARQLALPVVVVARATLGTINHTLLTIEGVERDGCAIGAVVLSRRPDEDLEFSRSNLEQIARRWPGRSLICSSDHDPSLDVLV